MECKYYYKPTRKYYEIVKKLYDTKSANLLYRRYLSFLKNAQKNISITGWTGVLVYEDGVIVAHAIVQSNKFPKSVYIGFIECKNDVNIAKHLLQNISKLNLGPNYFLPVDVSIWHSYRFKYPNNLQLPFDIIQKEYYPKLFNRFFRGKEYYSTYYIYPPKRKYEIKKNEYICVSEKISLQSMEGIYRLSKEIFKSNVHIAPNFKEFIAIYREVLEHPDDYNLIVSKISNKRIGYCFYFIRNLELFIKTLGVLPDFRKRGVGSKMYQSIVNHAIDLKVKKIYYVMVRDDKLISRLIPVFAHKVVKYVLYKGDIKC